MLTNVLPRKVTPRNTKRTPQSAVLLCRHPRFAAREQASPSFAGSPSQPRDLCGDRAPRRRNISREPRQAPDDFAVGQTFGSGREFANAIDAMGSDDARAAP